MCRAKKTRALQQVALSGGHKNFNELSLNWIAICKYKVRTPYFSKIIIQTIRYF